ncbi:aldo/keto reductase [Bacteroides timonensis]|uniref:aldo/keto reductase n=1 Tax=Bacteroides timonensis TaxID=1470345 RepID=UPI0004ADBEAE|nr:aldo/keto reductase [Bacteroides timonensis]
MKKYPTIALGTWSWGTGAAGGDQVFGNHLEAEDLKPVFEEAMKNGLNLWDTATVYGMGASEEILGTFTKQYNREEVIISTKFTPQIAGMYGDSMEQMCDASLKRFGTDYIDIYWIHNPADVERWTPELITLLKTGKVKSVGVSNHNLAELKRANEILGVEGFKVSAVQNHFSLLYRSSEEAGILDYCKENDIVFFAYMVLEQGVLTGKYNSGNPLPQGSGRGETYNKILPQVDLLLAAMRLMAERRKATISQIAIAWAIAKHTLPIIGVTKTKYIAETVAAASISLTGEEMALLENLAAKTGVDTKGSWEHPMI